jgi:4-amino-4-deoxychorismate lyase
MSTAVLVMIDHPSATHPGEPAFRLVPATSAQLPVTDVAVTRGDGIFETAAVRNGIVQSAERHLTRLARSAAMLDLPAPDPQVYRAAIAAAVAALPDAADAFVKYTLSRGDEENPAGPIGWVYADVAPEHEGERTDGLPVVLLSRGYALDIAQTAPWLLQGAKTLSYAVNKSVLREAHRRGAADVVFTTTDGYLLEGPTSSLVLRLGDTLVTTRPECGILAGTTQEDVFAFAAELGLSSQVRDIEVAELAGADAAWLMSSVRLAVPITSVDGAALPVDAELTTAINTRLMARTV